MKQVTESIRYSSGVVYVAVKEKTHDDIRVQIYTWVYNNPGDVDRELPDGIRSSIGQRTREIINE